MTHDPGGDLLGRDLLDAARPCVGRLEYPFESSASLT